MSTHQQLIEEIKNAKLAFGDDAFVHAASSDSAEITDSDIAGVTGNEIAGVSGHFAASLVGLSPLNQNDVLESLLYAQARANYEVKDPFADPPKWYKVFVSELGKIFWANVQLSFVEASISSEAVVGDLVLEFLKTVKTRKPAGNLIQALPLSPATKPRYIFNHEAAKGRVSNFQLGTAVYVGKNVELGITVKSLMSPVSATDGSTLHQPAELSTLVDVAKTEANITDVLSTSVSQSSTHFFESQFVSILDVGQYTEIRETIKQTLKENALNHIAVAPIA
ncbi:hypothetical protein FRC07_000935 [Ceratobasidium sp. 392]|nr:hypothetical protein FRC07_000935 [Ceratobasidium sp. 392]